MIELPRGVLPSLLAALIVTAQVLRMRGVEPDEKDGSSPAGSTNGAMTKSPEAGPETPKSSAVQAG